MLGGDRMLQQAKPPIEPEEAVAFVWGLSLELSNTPQKQALGEYIQKKFEDLQQSVKDPIALQYLQALDFQAISTLRNLSYRREGFNQNKERNKSILDDKIENYNKLANISVKDAKSLIPRLVSTIGGVSFSSAISNFFNTYFPTVGKISGLEVLLLGAFLGYILAEIGLRIYANIQIPRARKNAYYKNHIDWNRYIKESREIIRNFFIHIIRLRERLYPNLGTIGLKKVYSGDINKDTKLSIDYVIDDIIGGHLPIIHNDIKLSSSLRHGHSYFSQEMILQTGDTLSFSYSVLEGLSVNCYCFNKEAFDAWLNTKSEGEALYKQFQLSTGGDNICIPESGSYFIVFKNPSYIKSKDVSFGWHILRDVTRKFCFYKNTG